MADALVFAHPPEVRRKAKHALVKHGSLRKASAATGIPKSTLHYWNTQGGFDGLDDTDAEEHSDAPISPDEAMQRVQDRTDEIQANTMDGESADLQPDGFPETPQTVAGDTDIHNAPVGGWPQAPTDAFAVMDPVGATQDWFPSTTAGLKALFRYANSLIAGADPPKALRAAQIIDPDFGLTPDQDTRLLNSLKTLMMDETALFAAINPPSYVRDVYDKFAWGPDATSQLSDTLLDQYKTAYTTAINDQLSQLGRDPIQEVKDQTLLDKLSDKADGQAQAITDSWNKDLANTVGQNWIDLSSSEGRQMSQVKLEDAVNDWQDSRADYKAGQWAADAAGQTDAQAMSYWQDQNGTIQQVRFSGDDTDEPMCADLLDQYGDWTDIDDAPDFGDLPHSNCIHNWDSQQADVPADQQLWTGE